MNAWVFVGTPVVAFLATRLKNQTSEGAEDDREEHRVDVDREEITVALVPDPLAVRLADGQILEMVADVLAGCVTRFRHDPLASLIEQQSHRQGQ